jgi:hypothetical protein
MAQNVVCCETAIRLKSGAKRKWLAHAQNVAGDLIDRLLRDFGATQHGQRAAILIFKCSIN